MPVPRGDPRPRRWRPANRWSTWSGTPAFCQTGTCAPALESIIDVQDQFGDQFTFVHAEVYTDNTATEPAPAVDAAGLTYEPALFVTDSAGVVIERLDAVWDRTELVEVLERAS